MPSRTNRRERDILEVFLNGYQGGRWRRSQREWLDEHQDSAVELLATQPSGHTLAIEHTLVEIFVGDKLDIDRHKGFLALRNDAELVVFGKMISIQIPRGTLTPGFDWESVVCEFRNWLKAHIASFPVGESEQICPVSETGVPGNQIKVIVEVLDDAGKLGHLFVSRYGDADTTASVEKAIQRKVPKLVATKAERRILMFERNQFKQDEQRMFDTVERLQSTYPDMRLVDEWWCVETIAYAEDRPLTDRSLFFSRYERGKRTRTMMFHQGRYYPSSN